MNIKKCKIKVKKYKAAQELVNKHKVNASKPYLKDIDKYIETDINSAEVSYIYFIKSIFSKHENQNRIKIGFSTDPKERLKHLQNASPYPLKIWYTFPVSASKAKYIEHQLHEKFRWSRDTREWFKIHPCIVNWIRLHTALSYEKFNPKCSAKTYKIKKSQFSSIIDEDERALAERLFYHALNSD